MNKSLVSVIIPTYQRPINLIRAIESVFKQTYKYIEVIIVDDNGINTEWQVQTKKLLEPYITSGQIIYIAHDTNKNGSAARNTGLRTSRGEFINFLDDDDILEPQKIKSQIDCLNSHDNSFGACTCNTLIKGFKRSHKTNINKEGNLLENVLIGQYEFNTSTLLFRRNAILELNGFDESFFRHQDWELYVRFFQKYKMAVVRDILVIKISTPSIITKNPIKAVEYKEKFLNTFRMYIDLLPRHNGIYRAQYEMLALSLLCGGYKYKALQYIIKAWKYGLPSLWVLSKYIYYILKLK